MDVAPRFRCSEPHRGVFWNPIRAGFGIVGIGVFLALERLAKVGEFIYLECLASSTCLEYHYILPSTSSLRQLQTPLRSYPPLITTNSTKQQPIIAPPRLPLPTPLRLSSPTIKPKLKINPNPTALHRTFPTMPRRGGGGNSREVQISKAMSWLLRHGAKGEGIKMDANGFINVADLVSWVFFLFLLLCDESGGEEGGWRRILSFIFLLER